MGIGYAKTSLGYIKRIGIGYAKFKGIGYITDRYRARKNGIRYVGEGL